MADILKQSTATTIDVFMIDSSDHLSGVTGLSSLTIYMAKEGDSFVSVTPTVTEKGYGWYQLALTSSHTDTVGNLLFHITSGSVVDANDVQYIIEADTDFTPQDIWEYDRRILTYSPDNLSSISGSTLYIIRGDTYEHVFTGIDFTNFNKAYFTIKRNYKDTDCSAIVQVGTTGSLIILNGQRVTSGCGAMLTAGSSAQTLTLKIEASSTSQFPYSDDDFYYDLQTITTASVVTTPELGECSVIRDVTNKVT